jgi:hypothetical protein
MSKWIPQCVWEWGLAKLKWVKHVSELNAIFHKKTFFLPNKCRHVFNTRSYYRKENAASPQGMKGSIRKLLNI